MINSCEFDTSKYFEDSEALLTQDLNQNIRQIDDELLRELAGFKEQQEEFFRSRLKKRKQYLFKEQKLSEILKFQRKPLSQGSLIVPSQQPDAEFDKKASSIFSRILDIQLNLKQEDQAKNMIIKIREILMIVNSGSSTDLINEVYVQFIKQSY